MPRMPKTTAKPWPMVAATSVARALPIRMARSARSTRPPSMGKAGIMLNSDENDIGAGDLGGQRHGRVVDLREILRVEPRAKPEQQRGRDDHVHGWTGERHDQLLAGFSGICSMLAMPPNGHSVTSRVFTP